MLMNLLLYYTERSQNTIFHIVMLRISFYLTVMLILYYMVAVTTLLSRGDHLPGVLVEVCRFFQ